MDQIKGRSWRLLKNPPFVQSCVNPLYGPDFLNMDGNPNRILWNEALEPREGEPRHPNKACRD